MNNEAIKESLILTWKEKKKIYELRRESGVPKKERIGAKRKIRKWC
jgi:hypothetical protein